MYCIKRSLDKVKVMAAELHQVQVKDTQITRRVLDGTNPAILYTASSRGIRCLPVLPLPWMFDSTAVPSRLRRRQSMNRDSTEPLLTRSPQ